MSNASMSVPIPSILHYIGPRQHTDTLPRHFGGRRFGASRPMTLLSVSLSCRTICCLRRLPSPAVSSQHTHRSQTKGTVRGRYVSCRLYRSLAASETTVPYC